MDLWGISGLAVSSLMVEKEVEVSSVSSEKSPTSSYTGSSYTDPSSSSCSSTDSWDDFIGYMGTGWQGAELEFPDPLSLSFPELLLAARCYRILCRYGIKTTLYDGIH